MIDELFDSLGLKMGDRVIIILRGLPGSGKSTWARLLTPLLESRNYEVGHFEADQFFVGTDGVYRFDINLRDTAHAVCRRRFRDFMLKPGRKVALVTNTSTTLREIQAYQDPMGNADRYIIHINPKITVEQSFKNNVHTVPLATIQAMKDRWQAWPGELEVTPWTQ